MKGKKAYFFRVVLPVFYIVPQVRFPELNEAITVLRNIFFKK